MSSHEKSNPAISVIGGLILFAGWLFFNSVSGLMITEISKTNNVAQIMINTIISGSAAGMTFVFIQFGLLGS